MTDIIVLLQNFVSLFVESSPWLLLGLLVAGIMHELVPVSLLERHMGTNSASSIAKAAVIGAPLPLCSCGVIPAALGLRRSGASKPSTVSFLVSTPETGVDSVSVSYALLGPLFAIVRPIAAVLSAMYAGFMVRWFDNETAVTSAKASSSCGSSHDVNTSHSCCSKEAEVEDACCASSPASSQPAGHNAEQEVSQQQVKTVQKITRVISYASGKLLADIMLWLLIGLALAAAIQTWVPTDFLTRWGDGLVAMLVMAFIGVPMYICATASTPLAVGFLAAGLSPGAVLVFLMAGPATNVSTMGMIKQEMGSKTLVLYLLSVVSASVGFGYLLNGLVSQFQLQHLIQTTSTLHTHGANVQAIYALSGITLAGLIGRLYYLQIATRLRTQGKPSTSCCSS